MQAAIKPILDGMVKGVEPQAHFVPYASPSFISFRNGVYLELSINTTLAESLYCVSLPAGGAGFRRSRGAPDPPGARLLQGRFPV